MPALLDSDYITLDYGTASPTSTGLRGAAGLCGADNDSKAAAAVECTPQNDNRGTTAGAATKVVVAGRKSGATHG
jgi:hypothetical protein